MRPVKVRHPEIEVTLLKNVGRTTFDGETPVSSRFSGQQRSISLTQYLGDNGAVRVNKSVREPAGGFAITFADRINQEASDTVYGLVEPMDVVEIRMAGDAYAHSETSGPPIVMRGIISNVQRSEAMGGDGKPQRSVTIVGQDYGKIWQIMQIFNMPHQPDQAAALITSFPFIVRFQLTFDNMPISKFVEEIVGKVINSNFLLPMQSQTGNTPSTSPLFQLKTDIQIAGELDGTVSARTVGAWQGGTIHSLLAQICDVGAWNELFIEDREDGPYVVYRPNPFLKSDGSSYVLPIRKDKEPDFFEIGRDDVIAMSVSRSDSNVANYFWVDSPNFNIIMQRDTLRAMTYQGEPETFYVQNYGNVNPKLYGTRKMWEQTSLGGASMSSSGNGLPAGNDLTREEQTFIEWMKNRRIQLLEQNKDNVVFETGTMRIKGSEAIRAGTYVVLRNGNVKAYHYVVSVQHDYNPFVGFFTTVNFERGTGFIERVRQGDGAASPYWAELSE